MFDYVKESFVQSAGCTREAFDSLLTDTTVIDNCAHIKHLVDNIPADASDEELEAYKKQINKYKAGCPEKGIKPLPAWCFHATFRGGYRKIENAIPSGLCSIDLDHVQEPRQFFQNLQPQAIEQHLALAFITPSTRGLKMVFPIPEGAISMEEAQEAVVKQLGVEAYFDHSTMDLSRMAFAVPADYILYRNDEELFCDRTVSPDFNQIPTLSQEEQEVMVEHQPVEKASEHYVDGIQMTSMLQYLSMKYCGKAEPDVSQRNNTLYKVAKVMRVACQDDFDLLAQVMPRWGQDQTEWNKTLRSACMRPIAQYTMREYEEMMTTLKREKAISEGQTAVNLPEVPRNLPPLFREYARITPPELRPAVMMTLLPIAGFYGTMAQANYAEPDEREEMRTGSFSTIISATPSSCKHYVTDIYNELVEPVREREKASLAQLNVYNRTKKEEDKPKLPIRLMPEKLSMTSLSVQLENANGMHLLQFTPEIDTLKSSNGSGAWNDLSTVFRKATDNDCIGQIFMSPDSHCCNVPVYLNQIIEAQPETAKEFLNKKNVLNGMVSRILFVELPDNTGKRKPKMLKMSDFEKQNVLRVIEKLESIGVIVTPAEYDEEGNLVKPAVMERQLIKIPRVRKAMKRWGIGHQDHFLQTQENPAEDHYFRRAAMFGFQAGMVAYICSGCRETKEVIDFALWVAEYTLQSQLLHFGNIYNTLHNKRFEDRMDNIIQQSRVSKFNLLDALPREFTIENMRSITIQQGKNLSNPHIKVSRWKAAGLITEVPTDTQTKRWRKLTPIESQEASKAA